MIIDTSALIAALFLGPGSDRIFALMGAYGGRISAPTLVEARIVVRAKGGPDGERRLDGLIRRFDLDVAAFDALAFVPDEPLLSVGDDFRHTDIRSALEEYAG